MRARRHLLYSVFAGIAVVAAAPADAQARRFAIPGGPLKPALDAYARQTGHQVIYRIDDIRGRRSPGARGRITSGEALRTVLAGSGLTWRVERSGAIAIVPQEASQARSTAVLAPRTAAVAESAPLPEIVITGTRLRRPNLEAEVPTATVPGEEFFETGRTAVGETLNDLPALRSTLTQSNSTRLDTGAGLNMLDLRGLGIDRTLVLQNGRRHIPGVAFSTAVDVNTIPSDLIERVDVVSGGSSAIYGSDAIAGVVNFVLRRDFEGYQLRAQRGTSKHGDAGQTFLSGIVGANFADDRGNVAVSVETSDQDDWYASDRPNYRDVAAYVFVDIDEPGYPDDGIPDRVLFKDIRSFRVSNLGTFVGGELGPDGNVPVYLFQSDGRLTLQTGERVGLAPFAPFNGGSGSNLMEGKLFAYSPDVRRYAVNLLGHFTVSEAFEPFVEAKYVRIHSLGSAFGSFFSVGAWGPRELYRTDNPFLHPETREFIRSTMMLEEGEESTFFFRRNFAELGPIAQHNRRDTYRLLGGVRGTFSQNWSYELSANVARATSRTRLTGNVNVQRFLLAIDAVRDPATGEVVCRSQIDPAAAIAYEGAARPAVAAAQLALDVAECVPLNPFGEGNISPAARDYILADSSTSRSTITQNVLNAFVTGDSGAWFELPGGPVAIAIGAEHRRETFRDVQDVLLESGITHATPLSPFEPPAFSVREVFGELRLPLLKDRKAFEELSLSGAGRLADYRGSIGTVLAWNAAAEWAPIEAMRIRVNRSRAIRAPNLAEANQPLGQAFSNFGIRDPCSNERIGAGSANREANCRADGVPEGFAFVYPTSFAYLAGGNPDLHEERSDSLTVGAVVEPEFLPGLSLSVDYYDIEVRDVIASPSVQSILDSCYDAAGLDNQFCGLFDRNRGPGSGPNDELVGQIIHNSLTVVPLNYAALKVRGIDIEAAYRGTVPGLGLLNSRLIYTLALQNDSFLNPEDPGRKDQNLLELGNPRHAFNWDVSLKRGPITLGYELRHVSKMSVGAIENIRSVQGRAPEDRDAFATRYFPGATYHNGRVAFAVGPRLSVYVGADNFTNRLPPPSVSGVDDEGGIYDNIGRFFYMGAVARF